MNNTADNATTAANKCAIELNLKIDHVLLCTNKVLGNQLQHQMATQTDILQPKHVYVPWFTLNGIHTEDIQRYALNGLIELICNTYTVSKVTQKLFCLI